MRRAVDSSVERAAVEMAMRGALDLTRSTYPHPNPRVGAVVLDRKGVVRSSGVHIGPGRPHAEYEALAEGGFRDHTLVVTLEPCDHVGRTPPCTDAIIAAGISHVVVGAEDPDPRVSGRGIARLLDAGIDVQTGVLTDEIEAADPGYFFQRRAGRAMATLKLASTLDGQAAAVDGTSQWITGEQARLDAHRLRSEHDAVMVGAGTIIADRPSLDVRLAGYVGPQPRPVVVIGERSVPLDAPVMQRDPLVYADPGGVDLEHVLNDLPLHGILSVLVEGGPTLAHGLLARGLVDRVVWYLGGLIAGGTGHPAIGGDFATLGDALALEIDSVDRFGNDLRITARPSRRS